jgi:hypothetical protein
LTTFGTIRGGRSCLVRRAHFSGICLAYGVFAQQDVVEPQDNAVLCEPVEIANRDLYLGPGINLQPQFKGLKYIGRRPGGNNIKYRVMDGNGIEWIAKAGGCRGGILPPLSIPTALY